MVLAVRTSIRLPLQGGQLNPAGRSDAEEQVDSAANDHSQNSSVRQMKRRMSVQIDHHCCRPKGPDHCQTCVPPVLTHQCEPTSEECQLASSSTGIVATHLGSRSERYTRVKATSIWAFALGARSKLAYIKPPSTAEKTIGRIPRAGRDLPVMTENGNVNPIPKGRVRIVIARSWRYSSPDCRAVSDRCMLCGQV
jgi:hypothetical protein